MINGIAKPAGVRCIQLDEQDRCRLFGRPERPAVCSSLQPSQEMCGDSREQAMRWLGWMEHSTAPASGPLEEEGVDHFLALERQVWEALQRGDGAADARLLADGFLGVYDSGFGSKAEHVGQLAMGPVVLQFELALARLMRLSPNLGLLAYRARWTDGRGKPRCAYISSLWERGPSGWRNIFSQDTNAPLELDAATP